MADKKDEQPQKPSAPVALLDFELALLTYEANGISVSRRGQPILAACPKCHHETSINVIEFAAEDAVLRLKTCSICRHEVREGSSKSVAAPEQAQ